MHRDEYIKYRSRSRLRLIFMLFGVCALLILVLSLFVYVIQRNFPQKQVILSNDSQIPSSAVISNVASEETSSSSSGNSSKSISGQLSDWKLVLVNFENKMPSNFQQHIVHDFDIDMDQRIVQPFTDMYKAALQENITLWISSGYRSPQLQDKLFKDEIDNNKKQGMSAAEAEKKAALAVARAGYSEHNTGLAMDLNGVKADFDQTKAFQWLQKHAEEYGFVLRYPKNKESITKIMYEPWHYRYVGVENAKKMNEMHMCLEEYVAYLKSSSVER